MPHEIMTKNSLARFVGQFLPCSVAVGCCRQRTMLSLLGLVASGAFIASPLHTRQLAAQHHARALLPRAVPSAIVFDPGNLEVPAAVAFGAIFCIPIQLAVAETIDALKAVVTGTPLELIRVEVRALPPVCYPPGTSASAALRFCVLAAHARRAVILVVGRWGDPAAPRPCMCCTRPPFAAQSRRPAPPTVSRATSV